MTGTMTIRVMAMSAFMMMACGDDTTSTADANTDAMPAFVNIEVAGTLMNTVPDAAEFKVGIHTCPRGEPPKYNFKGTIDKTAKTVKVDVTNLPAGEYCLSGWVDMDPADGLRPIDKLDFVNATGKENAMGTIPVTVEEGKSVKLDLEFTLYMTPPKRNK